MILRFVHGPWTLLWLVTTQSTFLKYFRFWRFSKQGCKYIQSIMIILMRYWLKVNIFTGTSKQYAQENCSKLLSNLYPSKFGPYFVYCVITLFYLLPPLFVIFCSLGQHCFSSFVSFVLRHQCLVNEVPVRALISVTILVPVHFYKHQQQAVIKILTHKILLI